MNQLPQTRIFVHFAAASLFALLGTGGAMGQQLDPASVIQRVDAAVKARVDSIAGYTATEHYAVYRNNDETNPVAEMTVKTTYRVDSGKSYTILSQSGSALIRSVVLGSILNNEKSLNQPGIREETWITSANYQMQLEPGGTQPMNGRDCLVLTLTPRRKTPYLLQGKLWVDARDGSIVQVEGTASKSSSFLTGATQILRQYTNVSGYPEATRARAVSNSFMFGQTVVAIDYQNYQVQLRPPA
jgi:outer membrane lipoprotein-sorting protein